MNNPQTKMFYCLLYFEFWNKASTNNMLIVIRLSKGFYTFALL